MPTDPTSLSELTDEQVDSRKDILRDMLETEFPDINFDEGTVNQQIILQPNAEIDALQRLTIDRLRRSNSLNAISEDPALADDELVDNVFSNFFVTRREGTTVTGSIIVTFSASSTYTISSEAVFTFGTRTFNPDQDYVVVTTESLNVPNSLLLRLRSDGNYWVSIPVVETVVGGSVVAKDTVFTLSPEPTNFVSATASDDFVAGTPEETNEELAARLEAGTAMQSVSDRAAIEAVLLAQFPQTLDLSIIGLNDDESIRDTNNLLGINVGGKGDIYTRTSTTPSRVRVTVLGTYRGTEQYLTEFGVTGWFRDYRILMDVDSIAAFYHAAAVTYFNPSNTSSSTEFDYEFTEGAAVAGYNEISRGVRDVEEDFSPSIAEFQEAAYSRYQGVATIDIELDLPTNAYLEAFDDLMTGFSDTEPVPVAVGAEEIINLTVGELKDLILNSNDTLRIYDVYVDIMPDVNDIQDFFNDRDNRPPGADYLVKAPMPCFTGVDLTITYQVSGEAPSVQAVQEAVASAVNALPMGTQSLSVLTITEAVSAVLPAGAILSLPVEITGTVRQPDGTEVLLSSSEEIVLPSVPEQGLTYRTTSFLQRTDDVSVTLTTI
jgi:hypothetical protein